VALGGELAEFALVANRVPAVRLDIELPREVIIDVRGDAVAVFDDAAATLDAAVRCGGVVGVRVELAADVFVAEVGEEVDVTGLVAELKLNVRLVLVSFERLKSGRAVCGFCGVEGLFKVDSSAANFEGEVEGDFELETGDLEEEVGDKKEGVDFQEAVGDFEEEVGDFEEAVGDFEEVVGDFEEVVGDLGGYE
jgi:hypothetical protein